MCITPSYVWTPRGPGFEKVTVACRKCWQCLDNRVNDYVGRSLCEVSMSDWCVTLTLTYRDSNDPEIIQAIKTLNPRHFQTCIKSIRNDGHKIRYLVVGEYGSLKGRAHFHCILFGKGKRPDIPHHENFQWKHWRYGHTFADWNMDDKALRYVIKYLKNPDKGAYWFSLSKKPAIGLEYFLRRAETLGELGLMPNSFLYSPPGGQNRPYMLRGAVKRDYLRAVAANVAGRYGLDHGTLNQWVLDALDKITRQDKERELLATYNPHDDSRFYEELEKRRIKPESVKALLLELENDALVTEADIREIKNDVAKKRQRQQKEAREARTRASRARIKATRRDQAETLGEAADPSAPTLTGDKARTIYGGNIRKGSE